MVRLTVVPVVLALAAATAGTGCGGGASVATSLPPSPSPQLERNRVAAGELKTFYLGIGLLGQAQKASDAVSDEAGVCGQMTQSARIQVARYFFNLDPSREVACRLGVCIAAKAGIFGNPGNITANDFLGDSPDRMDFVVPGGITIRLTPDGSMIDHFNFDAAGVAPESPLSGNAPVPPQARHCG